MTATVPRQLKEMPIQPASKRRKKDRWSRFGLLAVLPFGAFLAVFGIYPLAELLRMSVSEVKIVQGGFTYRPVGLENFSRLASDPDTAPVLLVTLVFIVAAVLLTVALGTFLALILDRSSFMRVFAKRVLIWPTVIAPVVVSVIWLLLLSPTIGVLNKLLQAMGIPEQGWLGEPVGAMLAIIAVDVWHWTPLVFLLVYTSIQSVDSEVLEAAQVDGASDWQSLWHIMLPIVRPVVITAAAIRLIMSVKAFDEMFLLTHGGPGNATNLISLHIRTLFFDRLEFGYGAAVGVTIILAFAVFAVVYLVVRRLMRPKGFFND